MFGEAQEKVHQQHKWLPTPVSIFSRDHLSQSPLLASAISVVAALSLGCQPYTVFGSFFSMVKSLLISLDFVSLPSFVESSPTSSR